MVSMIRKRVIIRKYIFLLVCAIAFPFVAEAQTTNNYAFDNITVVDSSRAEGVLFELLQSELKELIVKENDRKVRSIEFGKDFRLTLVPETLGECKSFYGAITKPYGGDSMTLLEFAVIADGPIGKEHIFIVMYHGGGCPAKISKGKKVYKFRSFIVHRNVLLSVDPSTGKTDMTDGGAF